MKYTEEELPYESILKLFNIVFGEKLPGRDQGIWELLLQTQAYFKIDMFEKFHETVVSALPSKCTEFIGKAYSKAEANGNTHELREFVEDFGLQRYDKPDKQQEAHTHHKE